MHVGNYQTSLWTISNRFKINPNTILAKYCRLATSGRKGLINHKIKNKKWQLQSKKDDDLLTKTVLLS